MECKDTQGLARHGAELRARLIVCAPTRTIQGRRAADFKLVSVYEGVAGKCQRLDAAVAMVKHSEYLNLDVEQLKAALNYPVLIHGREFFPQPAGQDGFSYKRVGRCKCRIPLTVDSQSSTAKN